MYEQHSLFPTVQTRKKAQEDASRQFSKRQLIILESLERLGEMTCDEIAKETKIDILNVRPIMTTLRQQAVVQVTGETRKNKNGKHTAVYRKVLS